MTLVYYPHIGASVMLQSGTVAGNTSGASTYKGTNIVLEAGSNVTIGVSGGTLRFDVGGGSTGAAGAGTAWAITGGSITVNTSGGTISLPAYLTTAAPPGAYLTTAAQIDHSHGALSLVNLTGTSASNGLTLSAAAPGGGGAVMVSAGTTSGNVQTLRFQDSNGVSFGLSGSTVTASHNGYTGATTQFLTTAQPPGAYLTTAALSQDSSKYAGTNGAITGGSITVNTSGVSVALPAYLTTAANSTHTHSQYLTTARASNDAIGLNTALTGNGVSVTANSSGLSINVPAFLTTAQPPGAYLTTARASNDAVGLNTAATQVTWTVNSSGISLNAGAYLTTAMASNAGSGFMSTSERSNYFFTSNNTFANSTHSHGNPSLALTNLSGTTASASNGFTLSLSAAAPAGGGGVGLNTAATQVTWTVNTSGISLNAGAYLTTARASNDAVGLATAQTNATWTVNSAGLSLNAGGYAGTTTGATNASITLNSNGLAISVAAPGGGAGVTLSEYNPYPAVGLLTNIALGHNSIYFIPFDLPEAVSAYRLNLYLSFASTMSATNLTGSGGHTLSAALYSRPPASTTRIDTFWSMTAGWKITQSSNTALVATNVVGINGSGAVSTVGTTISNAAANTYVSNSMNGPRVVALPISSVLTPGRYWLALANSITSANGTCAFKASMLVQTFANNLMYGPLGTSSIATNAASGRLAAYPGGGTYSATSGAFPATVALTTGDIRGSANVTVPFFNFSAYTTAGTTI